MVESKSALPDGFDTSASLSQSYWNMGHFQSDRPNLSPAQSNLWLFNLPNVENETENLAEVVGDFFDAMGALWDQMKASTSQNRKLMMHSKIAQMLAVAARKYGVPDEHNAWLTIMSLYVSSLQSRYTDLRKQNGFVVRSLAVAIVRKAHGYVHDRDGTRLTKDAIRSIVFKSVSAHCTHLLAHGKLSSANQIAQWEKKRQFIADGFTDLALPALDTEFQPYTDQHFAKISLLFGSNDEA